MRKSIASFLFGEKKEGFFFFGPVSCHIAGHAPLTPLTPLTHASPFAPESCCLVDIPLCADRPCHSRLLGGSRLVLWPLVASVSSSKGRYVLTMYVLDEVDYLLLLERMQPFLPFGRPYHSDVGIQPQKPNLISASAAVLPAIDWLHVALVQGISILNPRNQNQIQAFDNAPDRSHTMVCLSKTPSDNFLFPEDSWRRVFSFSRFVMIGVE